MRNAVRSQTARRTLILNLAQVDRIDAGGLGELLRLRAWARTNGIQLKLMNFTGRVQQVLDLTNLDRVFEICSVENTFQLLPQLAQAAYSDRSS